MQLKDNTCCTDESATSASEDWVSALPTYVMAWFLPMALLPLGLLVSLPVRTAVWAVALAWMGVACLINARRCGRTHCRFTGPYYLIMIVPVALIGIRNPAVGLWGWILLGLLIGLGGQLLWWATERAWGRYS